MIDFHTHVLPGIDDGSCDLDMTEAMLREEAGQGVGLVVATPHFYANRTSVRHFLDNRDEAYKSVVERIESSGEPEAFPKLLTGAEVYYFSGIGTAEMLPKLTIGDTGVILVEMPFEPWTKEMYRDIETIIEKQKLKVVLAHIERYVEFQRDRGVYEAVMALPLTPQINAGTFIKKKTGLFHPDKKRKFALAFREAHPRMILGSDCHNLSSRKPNLREGRAAIEAAGGADALREIDAAAKEVLDL